MVSKFIVFVAAILAYAQAGVLNAPVAYSPAAAVSTAYYSTPMAAPVAIHAPAVGATHQSVLRSLGGNQAVSHYSKAVDSAFSSVRKYDTRITNDAVSVAHTPVVAHAAPYVAHAAPYVAHAAPYVAHAAPVVAHAAPAPVAVKTAAISYSPAVAVAHTTFEGLGVHYAY